MTATSGCFCNDIFCQVSHKISSSLQTKSTYKSMSKYIDECYARPSNKWEYIISCKAGGEGIEAGTDSPSLEAPRSEAHKSSQDESTFSAELGGKYEDFQAPRVQQKPYYGINKGLLTVWQRGCRRVKDIENKRSNRREGRAGLMMVLKEDNKTMNKKPNSTRLYTFHYTILSTTLSSYTVLFTTLLLHSALLYT